MCGLPRNCLLWMLSLIYYLKINVLNWLMSDLFGFFHHAIIEWDPFWGGLSMVCLACFPKARKSTDLCFAVFCLNKINNKRDKKALVIRKFQDAKYPPDWHFCTKVKYSWHLWHRKLMFYLWKTPFKGSRMCPFIVSEITLTNHSREDSFCSDGVVTKTIYWRS